MTPFEIVRFIGISDGVHINGTIYSEKYISLTLKNVNLHSDKAAMDLKDINSLSLLDSTVEGFILSLPNYYNHQLNIDFINNTFYVCKRFKLLINIVFLIVILIEY